MHGVSKVNALVIGHFLKKECPITNAFTFHLLQIRCSKKTIKKTAQSSLSSSTSSPEKAPVCRKRSLSPQSLQESSEPEIKRYPSQQTQSFSKSIMLTNTPRPSPEREEREEKEEEKRTEMYQIQEVLRSENFDSKQVVNRLRSLSGDSGAAIERSYSEEDTESNDGEFE